MQNIGHVNGDKNIWSKRTFCIGHIFVVVCGVTGLTYFNDFASTLRLKLSQE